MPQITNYPGTVINEIDNSLVFNASYGSYVATMGRATKGIANSRVLLHTEKELISTFGIPMVSGSYPLISSIDYGIYAAKKVLEETGNTWYVRLTDGTEKYAGVTTSGTYTPISAYATSAYSTQVGYENGATTSDILDLRTTAGLSELRFNAIGPGKYGNNIAVQVLTVASSGTSEFDWNYVYDNTPADPTAKWRKIFKVKVFVKDSADATFASVSASPAETFYCSTDLMMVDNVGNSLFVEDVINGNSKYIYVRSVLTNGTNPTQLTAVTALTDGDDSTLTTPVDTAGVAWSFFTNKETSPVDILLPVPKQKDTATYTDLTAISTLLGNRYDFVTPLQVGNLTATTEATIKAADTTLQNSIPSDNSYYAKYVGWTLVYDAYNASRVYLPNSILAASVMARVDRIAKPWEAPAGLERGVIASGKQNVEISPAVGGRLYDLNLNTIKFVNGTGNVIWGQKTAQLKNTARNRLNVRRGLLVIEKNVERILNNFLFRGNTPKERTKATTLVSSFMQGVLAGGGVQSYKVVADETNNNTSSNTLNVDLYIQPTYTIEFIKLNTIISASSVTTSEG